MTETTKPARASQLTPFGKVLRKLRIDHNERLADMAKRLGISGAYLSFIETGNKPVPESWPALIAEHYELSSSALEELHRAVARSEYTIKLTPEATPLQRAAAEVLVRRWNMIDDNGAGSLLELLDDIAPDTPEGEPA
ncbi:helix-turn-helix domain-containing protein [Chitinimonas lacunae]|uniref:Helix-turn-helix transcriptional regulator n=1 Tax=Chitinimonas lacunae TaxID=1963018 RepID=A0ABV8MXE8_9NEIS